MTISRYLGDPQVRGRLAIRRPDTVIPPYDGPCIVWQGYISRYGYGLARIDGRTTPAHRVMYERSKGRIPDGLVLDHLCRNRGCVNPEHLDPVTGAVNTLRGMSPWAQNARKEVCERGHELIGENLRVGHNGGRRCVTCHKNFQNESHQRVYWAKKAAGISLYRDQGNVVTPAQLREVFDYDYETGVLFRKINPTSKATVARVAGSPGFNGQLTTTVSRRGYPIHRIVWAMHYDAWPSGFVKHRNGIRTDNRIENLWEDWKP